MAELALDLEPLHGAGPHLRVEELAAGAPALLGAIHRGVGIADQRVRLDLRVARPGDRDPDAGADVVLNSTELEGPGEGGRDALRNRHRLALVGEILDEDPELVATEAGDGVTGPQVGAEARRDRAQQLVSGVVAEAVVDHLEV